MRPRRRTAARSSSSQRRALGRHQRSASLQAQVQQRQGLGPAEAAPLAGGLELHQLQPRRPRPGRAATRLQSTAARWSSSYSRSRISPRRGAGRPPVQDAHAHRRHLAHQGAASRPAARRARARATQAPVMAAQRVPPSALSTSQSRVIWRSPRACEVHRLAQAAADEALDLHGPALLPALGRLPVGPGVGAAGQHAVLGGDPAPALALHPGRAPAPPGWPSRARGCRPGGSGRSRRRAPGPRSPGRRFLRFFSDFSSCLGRPVRFFSRDFRGGRRERGFPGRF